MLGEQVGHDVDVLGADREVHRAADGRDRAGRAGATSWRGRRDSRHLERAEHADVEVSAAHHRERVGVVEVRGAGQLGDGLLAGVDEVGVDVRRHRGLGPIPSIPFSVCRMISRSAGRKSATRVGAPMPRFTIEPSGMSAGDARGEFFAADAGDHGHASFVDGADSDAAPAACPRSSTPPTNAPSSQPRRARPPRRRGRRRCRA